MVGDKFGMDPKEVMQADNYDWFLRLAALQYINEEEAKANARAESEARSRR